MDEVINEPISPAKPVIIEPPAMFEPELQIGVKNNDVAHGHVYGGDATVRDRGFQYLLIGMLIIFIVWLVFSIYKQYRIAGEDRNQRLTRYYFNNIRGEDFDDVAHNALLYGEAIEAPRAIDHFRLGTVYLVNARDNKAAHRHFSAALNQIIDGNVPTIDAPFILNRIQDFETDVEDLPLQQALVAYYGAQKAQNIALAASRTAHDGPDFVQRVILSRQNWQPDSQNVHDSALYSELREQIYSVIKSNNLIPNIQNHDYKEAVNWIRVKYSGDPRRIDVEKVIGTMNNNYPVGIIPDINEQDVITAVWQRSFDPANHKTAAQIRNLLCDAIYDCVERGSVVCMAGRVSKIWQTLARVDYNDETGVLKTKQALRNEIFQRAAKIVDDYVGENGSVSIELKSAYNNNEQTEQVLELVSCIKTKIDDLADEYKQYIDDEQLNILLEECKAVV